jgi:hypothetical protein
MLRVYVSSCAFLFVLTTVLFLGFVHLALAQQSLGSVNGAVSESSGAVVQGAQVRLRAVATNLV